MRVWWETPRWRGPWITAGHPGDHERRAAQGQRRVGGVERDHAPMAERRCRPEDARARPAEHRVPAEIDDAVMDRAGGGDRLPLPAERLAGGQVPGQQPAVPQLPDHGGEAPGQGAPGGLDVTEAGSSPAASPKAQATGAS